MSSGRSEARVPEACAGCPVHNVENLVRLGIDMNDWDYVIALAGNPNTGKSTVFNRLTGLRQHTGNWPGKTVTRAEGGFEVRGARYKLVDLPGTYSLFPISTDEEVARDFILFGNPDVVLIVLDATRLERNLNLCLQILEITERAVVCLNLMDEADRRGLRIDVRRLSKDLGVPVVPTVARYGKGSSEVVRAVCEVAEGSYRCHPHRKTVLPAEVREARDEVAASVRRAYPDLKNAGWVALRLLEGDATVEDGFRRGLLGSSPVVGDGEGGRDEESFGTNTERGERREAISEALETAGRLRWRFRESLRDRIVESLYTEAARIADRCVIREGAAMRRDPDLVLDRILTHPVWGFPVMLGLLAIVLWLTIAGANVPSEMISRFLIGKIYPLLKAGASSLGLPRFLVGLLIDGGYLATAWVVSVMLPPMAIFFPLFTLLEDFGYLPRVAFNLDPLFRRAGAHGKQALTMSMGFGCNAAGVVATRIIDSPRERLIAIITNNFSICNGRWPMQILMASIFVGAVAPPVLAGAVSALAVLTVAVTGVILSLLVSWVLSRTVLKGEASVFSLELPPYRPPRILQTLYTSLIDRTIIVLGRAVLFAFPAGLVIWLIGNLSFGGAPLAVSLSRLLDPLGTLMGLNGVVLLAFIVAIPANEIIIPTILMLTVMVGGLSGVGAGPGVMFEANSISETARILEAGGWTLLTGINLMIFSLLHNPCSTTIFTIWKETRRVGWTLLATFLPVGMGFLACVAVATVWRVLT
ncbi:MAG: ferrous iron transport protein B [Candidatus Hydrogenedentota bacterium]|nr:MAG: ferrous iron transport protein B [Candidatus Hydrogenedentota bacterium]